MTQIINTTPHAVILLSETNEVLETFPKTDAQIRLSTETVAAEPIGDIPTTKTVFGDVEGLPNFTPDTYYIVSQLVKNALPNRTDLLVPADIIRDNTGMIVGCRSFGR